MDELSTSGVILDGAKLSSYKRDGFLFLRGLFQPHEVDEVRDQAKDIFIAQMRRCHLFVSGEPTETEFEQAMYEFFQKDLGAFINCAKQAHYITSLHRMGVDQRVLSALRGCGLATPIISKFPTIYFNSRHLAKQEHYWRQRQHQDWRILQSSLDAVVLWVALVDIDSSLGALEVIPGSHTEGLFDNDVTEGYGVIKPEGIDEARFVSMEVKKGDALLFSQFLVHQSGVNSTESIRWSIHFRYANLSEPTFIERAYPQPFDYRPTEHLVTQSFPTAKLLRNVFA